MCIPKKATNAKMTIRVDLLSVSEKKKKKKKKKKTFGNLLIFIYLHMFETRGFYILTWSYKTKVQTG